MEDVVRCPRCESVCIEDSDDHCAQCPKCLFAFCSLCTDAWHPGRTCLNPLTRLEVLAARRSGNKSAEAAKQADLLNQIQSLKLLADTSKPCPACRTAISKSGGCNKMACTNCGAYFCWRCLRKINGYDHFGTTCMLFEGQEPDAYGLAEGGAALVQVAHFLRQQGGGVRFCRCPGCGQENAKFGNLNLIRCWACTKHFCYACRARLEGKPGAHFGPRGCKQHSAD